MFAAIYSYTLAIVMFLNASTAWLAQPLLAGADVVLAIWLTLAGSIAGWQHFQE